MSQELAAAEDHLRPALDRYVRACSSARDACISGGWLNSSPDLLKNLQKRSDNIASHIQKLQGARAVIHAARNSISKITLLNEFPAEILAHIFQLVLPGQSCLVLRGSERKMSKIKYPLFPDALAHVCSYWRRIAITTPSLWTHIDIALDHSLNPGLFARAKVYATRAGQLPLEIHISDPGSQRESNYGGFRGEHPEYNPSHDWDDLNDFKVLAADTVPIKSLEFDLKIHTRYRDTYYSVLEYFFARSKPGVLTRYATECVNSEWLEPPFIEPAETPYTRSGALLTVPSAHLEELWLRIPIVRINCLCPHYKSKLYHGLTELYIGKGIPEITGLQLVNILRSSPKLQVFHLNAPVEFADDDEGLFEPVYLEDLRCLNIMIRGDDLLSGPDMLRWITPGSESLRLAYMGTPCEEEFESFFSRANVTEFYVMAWISPLSPALKQTLRLEILVLNVFGCGTTDLRSLLDWDDIHISGNDDDNDNYGGSDEPVEHTPAPAPSSTARIDTLCLLWYLEFAFEDIQKVVEMYLVQRLFIYSGYLCYQTEEERVVCDNPRNIRAKLATITTCPIIEYFPKVPSDAGDSIDPDDWIDTGAWSRF
ncbi:unnamed protein product [Rhizoctonia solani]|uniref:F-box domain-containing protein n=1 Tax=Rhizoctonia solani TaxID=456999 RepID=A0A8H2XKM4_9AGAM|nr:unnamed protein product [Rhizoctonia solani]